MAPMMLAETTMTFGELALWVGVGIWAVLVTVECVQLFNELNAEKKRVWELEHDIEEMDRVLARATDVAYAADALVQARRTGRPSTVDQWHKLVSTTDHWRGRP